MGEWGDVDEMVEFLAMSKFLDTSGIVSQIIINISSNINISIRQGKTEAYLVTRKHRIMETKTKS